MDDKKDTKQHQALSYRSVEQSEADNNKTVYENCFNWIELCMTYVSSLAIMNRRLAMKKLNENTWCIGLAPLEGLVRSSRRAVMWVSLSLPFLFSREGSWIFSINSSSKSSSGNTHGRITIVAFLRVKFNQFLLRFMICVLFIVN